MELSSPTPSFGILLCTYNGEKYLPAQLQSLLTQSQYPSEMWVLDDESQDRTWELLLEFQARAPFPVHLHRNSQNFGPGPNFLQGLHRMQSDWTLFCDQDDLWHQHKIAAFAQCLGQNPQAQMIYSDADLIDSSGNTLPHSLWQSLGFNPQAQMEFLQDPMARIVLRPLVIGMCCGVHTSSALRAGNPPYALLHDEWLSYRFALDRKIALLPQKLAQYRQHPKQQTGVRKPSLLARTYRSLSQGSQLESDLLRSQQLVQWLKLQEAQDYVKLAGEQSKHLHIRQNGPLIQRLAELLRGNYHRFSAGIGSFIKDFGVLQ